MIIMHFVLSAALCSGLVHALQDVPSNQLSETFVSPSLASCQRRCGVEWALCLFRRGFFGNRRFLGLLFHDPKGSLHIFRDDLADRVMRFAICIGLRR